MTAPGIIDTSPATCFCTCHVRHCRKYRDYSTLTYCIMELMPGWAVTVRLHWPASTCCKYCMPVNHTTMQCIQPSRKPKQLIYVCIDMLAMSSQQSKSQIYTRFRAVIALVRDDIYHSVWRLLDVAHHARLSRFCRERPRPRTRCLPARVAAFGFSPKYVTCVFERIDRYQPEICHAKKRVVQK